jgi:hypothetical protein
MGLLRLRLRAERRAATRWVGAVLLLALAGGSALIAAQAARRTDTAFRRDLVAGRASDAVVNANAYGISQQRTHDLRAASIEMLDEIDRSPLVIAHGRFGGANLFRIRNGKLDQSLNTGSAFGLVAYDDRIGRTISIPRIYSGRLAAPARADEITISPKTAELTGWRVGTRVTDLREFEGKDLDPETGAPRLDRGVPLDLHVVGVVDIPEELLQPRSERVARVFLTPAFARRFPETVFYLNEWVRLRHGTSDLGALRATVDKVNRAHPEVAMPIAPTGQLLAKVNGANDPLVNGLWMLSVLFVLVGTLLGAQSLGRTLTARVDEHAQLRAVGATRGQRLTIEIATLAIVALTAAVLAALLAYLLSPLTPIGAARDAEPNPGFSLDLALSIAAIGVIFAGTMIAALPALRQVVTTNTLPGTGTGRIESRQRTSRAVSLLAGAGLPTPAVVGTGLALQPGRGANATPVRSVLASLILVIATVTATFAFGVNLQRWTTTPGLYGWNWDVAAGSSFGTIPRKFEQAVEGFPHVEAVSGMTIGQVKTGGVAIPAIGITPLRGEVAPRMDAGRLPNAIHEIALGARTMRAIHKHVGDVISASVGPTRTKLTIVGRTTFAAFGNERGGESGLGTGALGTASRFPVNDPSTPGGRYNYLLLRFAPGTARTGVTQLRAFLAKNGCADPTCVLTDSRPAEINGYRSARGLTLAIGIGLVLLLVATLSHVLISTMRRRSSDLAILRALGCTPRNQIAIMRWQGLVLTSAAILIGVPCGLVANRVAWGAFSRQLGIAPGTATPFAALAIATVGVLGLAIVLATVVGRSAPKLTRRYRLMS